MSKLKVINTVILIENVMCVFRNYSFLSWRMKTLALFRIFLAATFNVYAFVRYYQKSVEIFHSLDYVNSAFVHVYNFCSKGNTLVALVLSVSNAQSFARYVIGMNSVNELCSRDVLYRAALKRLNRRVAVVGWMCVSLSSVSLPVYIYDFGGIFKVVDTYLIDVLFATVLILYRYILESFAYYTCTEAIVMGLQYLNMAVAAAVEKLKDGASITWEAEDYLKLSEDLGRWGEASKLLVDSSDHLTSSFGVQIGLSLYSVILYFIILMYRSICILAHRNQAGFHRTGWVLVYLLGIYLLVKMQIVNAGQRARSEANRLTSALAKMRALLAGNGEASACAGAASALARRLRAKPLRVQLLAGVAVQMSLATQVLASVLGYTIILLQFNHVV